MINSTIHTFLIVAKRGSYRKASKELFLSSVAVKKQMDQLENRLGISLFYRTAKGCTLTKAGKEFYDYVSKVEQEYNTFLNQWLNKYNSGNAPVRIANALYEDHSIRNFIFSRIKNYEFIDISFKPFFGVHNYTIELMDQLGKDYDCFITPQSFVLDSHFSYFPLTDFPATCILTRKNKLSNLKKITLKDLNSQTLYLCQKDTFPIVNQIRRDLKKNNLKVKIVEFPIESYLDFYKDFDDDNGILISFSAWETFTTQYKNIPLENYSINCGIYYPKEPNHSLSIFLKCLSK